MQEQTLKALKLFSLAANWGSLGHPMDMERFWTFTIVAFNNGDTNINSEKFAEAVSENCTDEDAVRKMFFKYEDAMELLRVYRTSGS